MQNGETMRYLVEYEFKTNMDNHYWLPLFINAENEMEARIIDSTIQTAINAHYVLKPNPSLRLVYDGINAEQIETYIRQRFVGRVETLELDIWRFKSIPTIPELNFNEHLALIEVSENFSEEFIAKTIERHQFPVRLYSHNSDFEFKEFLLLNVVDPKNIETVYIIIEVSREYYLNSEVNLINEGIWKNAHLKGFMIRIDSPHTLDGKRHIHIARSKHIHSKNKQVSWNDDLTRHDKKSFDSNFTGIERAKEIARKELGLDNNAILENAQPNIEFLNEGINHNSADTFLTYLRLT